MEQVVLNENDYVTVIGGVNIDIGGKPFRTLIPRDSNPGRVMLSLGGVGRNIAHNLSLLGIPVRFLTAFGDDVYALRIEASCAELGIDIQDALKLPGGNSSVYLFLSNERGDMELAVSDMEICERIDAAYLKEKQAILDSAKLIVADTNIPEEALVFLAEHTQAPLFVDPVSVTKSEKLSRILGRIHTLKPNIVEAENLSGVSIHDEASVKEAAQRLLETGLKRVFISLGAKGVFAAENGNNFYCPKIPADIRNATGAGDSFMAALVYACLHGMNLEETARFASTAAAMTIESIDTVNASLSPEAIEDRIRKSRP